MKKTVNILIPLPDFDFDTTEVTIPWKRFKDKGYTIVFATQNGLVAKTDPLLLTGVIFGQLGAKKPVIKLYKELEKSTEFLHPIRYKDIQVSDYDLLHLSGGHAKGVIPYLENMVLQKKVVEFFKANKIIGSVCHGGLVLARSIDSNTGKSIIYDKKVTALIKVLERAAYYVTSWKLGDYYRTYPKYTQDEVMECLKDKKQFVKGNPLKPMIVEDGNLVTARWPEDIELYAKTLIEKLEKNILN
jgi:putative intracellular protease/amidase